MPNSLTSSGLTTITRSELITFLQTSMQSIYGSTIDLDSDTPDGQLINLLTQVILDLSDLNAQIYNSFDPDNAIGTVLDQRVAINGIQRLGGTYTTVQVTITLSAGAVVNLYGLDQTLQPVYTLQDSAGNQWQLITTALNVTSTSTLLFQAANTGPIAVAPNTITSQVTIVLGVSSVNNSGSQVALGVAEETDAALKIRRQKSVSLQTQGYFQGLLAALENINGVTSAFVIENTTDTTNGDGIPGHSIWVIVAGTPNVALAPAWSSVATYSYNSIASSGGVNYISVQNSNTNHLVSDTAWWKPYNPIAQAIYNYRNAGCGMFNSLDAGANSYTVTQIDGSFFTVYWDSVITQNLFIKFTASSLNGVNPPNIAAIKTSLASNFVPGVYQEVNINQLATIVQQADSNTLVTNSGFSTTSGGSYSNTLTPSAKNKQFLVTSADIIVLPMILSCTGCAFTFSLISGAYQVTNTTISVAHGGTTIQFSTLGGFGTLTYAVTSGAGSINSSTGLYTSSTAGTDVVTVTDGLGNTATATITVV